MLTCKAGRRLGKHEAAHWGAERKLRLELQVLKVGSEFSIRERSPLAIVALAPMRRRACFDLHSVALIYRL